VPIPSTDVATSRAWVEVHLDALLHNLRTLREAAGGAALIPMVKANAYGLGMVPVARHVAAALRDELWGFGVAAVAEGEALRESGWPGRIVVFAPIAPGEYGRAARAGLTLALSETSDVRRWRDAARELGTELAFHTEIDTGMGRAGFPDASVDEWGPAVAALAGDLLRWEGCFTHFYAADEPELAPADEQYARFAAAAARLPAGPQGAAPRVMHSANSAAAVRRGGYGGDVVRPGIYVYGGEAGPGARPRAVAALRARLARVREVPAGTTVGYGATYAARGTERWGTLAIGYGDGLPRRLATAGGEALVHGTRVPIIGRISMDVTVVDLSGVPGEVHPGDVATLIGSDGADEIRVDEVAARCGTISYEILTGLGLRLPRTYPGVAAGD
jgi:alanine racemase